MTLPDGHPPVPKSATNLCAAALEAAAKEARGEGVLSQWFGSNGAVAIVTLILTVAAGVRRWRIERARAQREDAHGAGGGVRAAPPMATARPIKGGGSLEAWLEGHVRRPKTS